MERTDILQRLDELFEDTLGNGPTHLREDTTAREVEDWDSLNHVQLVYAIEQDFHIEFNAIEVQTWKNVGQMITSIRQKLGEAD
jgi:acyl carrier protein